MSEEIKNIRMDRMRYSNDRLSFALTILGLLFNVFYFVCLYKNNGAFYYTITIGASVIYNLLFMLFVFLSAEEVKIYNHRYGILLIAIGVLQIVRIFIFPPKAIAANTDEETIIQAAVYARLVIYLVLSALCLVAGGITSCIKSMLLKNYIKSVQAVQA